jgi:hypothetical protein
LARIERWQTLACSADGGMLAAGAWFHGIWVSQSTLAPRLDITPTGDGVSLAWLVPSATFSLQQTSDLATGNWSEVTNTPVFNFGTLSNEVILSAPAASCFFRLKNR